MRHGADVAPEKKKKKRNIILKKTYFVIISELLLFHLAAARFDDVYDILLLYVVHVLFLYGSFITCL